MTRLTGVIDSVRVVRSGANLVADAAAGATTLLVDSLVDFDDDGGTLSVNGEDHAYTAIDEDNDSITLAGGGLVDPAYQDDPVTTLDINGKTEIDAWLVMVDVDGDDGGDLIPAEVDTKDQGYFPEHDDGLHGLLVDIESYNGSFGRSSEDMSSGWRVVSRPFQEARLDSTVIQGPAISAYLTANQTIPNSTVTRLSGVTIEYSNTDVIAEDILSPGKFRVAVDGYYMVILTVRWANNGTGRRVVQPRWHTYLGDIVGAVDGRPAEAVAGMSTQITDGRPLLAGEGVSCDVLQSSGAGLDALGGVSQATSTIRIVRVGS